MHRDRNRGDRRCPRKGRIRGRRIGSREKVFIGSVGRGEGGAQGLFISDEYFILLGRLVPCADEDLATLFLVGHELVQRVQNASLAVQKDDITVATHQFAYEIKVLVVKHLVSRVQGDLDDPVVRDAFHSANNRRTDIFPQYHEEGRGGVRILFLRGRQVDPRTVRIRADNEQEVRASVEDADGDLVFLGLTDTADLSAGEFL